VDNTNYIAGIVRILESPKEKLIKNSISVTEFRVQFPHVRKGATVVQLRVWGNLAREALTYYKVNDYVLIEGYLSLRDKKNNNQSIKASKKVVISIVKLYPFILN
jgi:single-stranded DNA-binding protein